ncbi:ABC transporter ATP-binding protein [Candidatus Epulonipiscium fishelsonii]|uniref:ABC transporter ATP-binding protein n=1 Tax=Candidatus Epulonipiscium fishelsonii TaxID=77094 RepID=A0ACC8XC89_9FIRM|nr:ABC transporter ATP-binding protein [Epulopiscium sp. SCG-B11WGA-EpuloA1]ONI42445.1 ABC transporter ATP-binding protein [Epulopiscium sp. SCG-B05WGA-EpuloA1]
MKVLLDNVGKKYEGRENFTLRHIDLEIEDKDFCVILGPSGCGKSTLLRMIAGLNSITEGDLIFGDRRVNKVPSKDRDIAMVFQSYALYPHMTVYDNMAFSLAMRKEPKKLIHERVMEAAKVLQIENYLYSKPSDISGGQRQRVALGRAMVRKPKVFLMDEPLSNLDAKLREHMRVELVKLHKALETTSIYVTHDQVEAMTMATKIVLMDGGKIQQVGKPEDFYNRPENVFVAKFIGSPTMNLVEGKMRGGKFVSDDGAITLNPSDADAQKLKEYENKSIIVGIRSERFITENMTENILDCTLDIVELLGKEKTIYARYSNGKTFVVTIPGHLQFKVGDNYKLAFDKEALHFFDGETNLRIN